MWPGRYAKSIALREEKIETHGLMSLFDIPGYVRSRRGPKKTNSRPIRLEHMTFAGYEIDVERRAYSRRICLTVKIDGHVRLVVPMGYPRHEIEKYVIDVRDWIEHRQALFKKTRERYPRKRYCEGEMFPFLGRQLKLRFELAPGDQGITKVMEKELVVALPAAIMKDFDPHEEHPQGANALRRVYKEAAVSLLRTRAYAYAERMEVAFRKLSFRSQKTRWGSCNSKGDLSFNWRLIVAPLHVFDYVVIHELAHLKHFNHSKAFWALVAEECPRYKECIEWLRMNQYEGDFLAKKSELYR